MSNCDADFDCAANLSATCRCCLNPTGAVDIALTYNLEDGTSYMTTTIKDMISACTQISIEENDGLPESICSPCVDRVSTAFLFRHQTRQSDDILRKLLVTQNTKLANKLGHDSWTNTLENIIENVENKHNGISKSKLINVEKRSKRSEDEHKTRTQCNAKKKYENLSHDTSKESNNVRVLRSTLNKKNSFASTNTEMSKNETHWKRKKDYSKTSSTCKTKSNSELSRTETNESLTAINIENIESEKLILFNNTEEILTEQESSSSTTSESMTTKNKIKEETKSTKKTSYPPIYKSPDEPQKCSVCNVKCSNVHELIKHRSKAHGPKKFQCLTCGNGMTTTRGLRIHMRLHTGEKPEVCLICGKAFSDPRTLKGHMGIHTGQHPFPCSKCDKRFPSKLSLTHHLQSHTGEKPYQCSMCGKSYFRPNSLQIHIRTHTGIKPYPCKICDKAFTNSTSLSVHMLVHSGVKNFQCPICGVRMARSCELTIHLRTHSGERPFHCSICNKSFTNSSSLQAHIPTHTGIKNFVCSVCGKRVARAMELRVHMRTHTGERQYQCPHCDQRFTTSGNMKLHMRKHTGEKPFSCKICNRRFADSHILRNHMRTHTGERPYICNQCGRAFTQYASLKTHLNTHQKKDRDNDSTMKKICDASKESQMTVLDLGIKSVQEYMNIDEISLSKILTSSGNLDRTNIDLQECLPVDIHQSNDDNGQNINYNLAISNESQIINIIHVNRNGDYMQSCATSMNE